MFKICEHLCLCVLSKMKGCVHPGGDDDVCVCLFCDDGDVLRAVLLSNFQRRADRTKKYEMVCCILFALKLRNTHSLRNSLLIYRCCQLCICVFVQRRFVSDRCNILSLS